MRSLIALLAVLLLAVPARVTADTDALADARRLYNLGDYDGAERAALLAIAIPSLADAGRVVLGRIQLERYRLSGDEAHLGQARSALRDVDPQELGPREQLELSLGFAEALYLEDRFGAAAELFEPLIDGSALLGMPAHDRVLDWWATALDRYAQLRPEEERAAIYDRILKRMTSELAMDITSAPASYWLAAAMRGRGNVEGAWQAAMAGWMRAPLARDRGAALRADLDRLVVQGIIPARTARLGLKDPAQAQAGMLGEWEAFKAIWQRDPK
jgi:HAMP domain-containing protein